MTGASSKRPLTQLNHEIEQAEADASRLEKERAHIAKDARRAARKLRYLRLARWLRRPAASIEMWRSGLMVVAPSIVGVLLFVLVHLLFGSFLPALFAFLAGASASVIAISALLYRPPDELLQPAIADAESQCRLETARLREKTERLSELSQRLKHLIDQRRDQIASGKLQRAERNGKILL
jgi:hypothetical protein